MTNEIIELKCIDCEKIDRDQFVADFSSTANEKFQMTFHEVVPISTVIRLNTYYHTIQKIDGYNRISIKQNYITRERPIILELFLADKYETKSGEKISVYKDSNTLEIFKMIENENQLKLNSTRLINIEKGKLGIIKKPSIFNGNYIIENWILQIK